MYSLVSNFFVKSFVMTTHVYKLSVDMWSVVTIVILCTIPKEEKYLGYRLPLQRAEQVGRPEDECEGDEVAHEDTGQQHEGELAAASAHHRRAALRHPNSAHHPGDTAPHSLM